MSLSSEDIVKDKKKMDFLRFKSGIVGMQIEFTRKGKDGTCGLQKMVLYL